MSAIVFVCTANRFRSPIAAIHFARQVVRHGHDSNISVSSAGTWTVAGQPVTQDALILAEEYNLNLSMHQSRPITKEILTQADLVLVMENSHKEAILNEFPFSADRVYLLAEAAEGTPFDIPDPYGSEEPPDEIAHEIITMIDRGYDRIVKLAQKSDNQNDVQK